MKKKKIIGIMLLLATVLLAGYLHLSGNDMSYNAALKANWGIGLPHGGEENLAQEEVLSAISKLPLVSIVTGENRCMGEILKIKEELDKKGIHKIFNAKNPSEEFLAKLKEGMLIYSGENAEYRDNLGVELLEEILN